MINSDVASVINYRKRFVKFTGVSRKAVVFHAKAQRREEYDPLSFSVKHFILLSVFHIKAMYFTQRCRDAKKS